jgi:pimeloyl-ACP methyl ester carboxylesterase
LSPKPPAGLYREQLERVLISALSRSRPRAARWLDAHPDAFVVVGWTDEFYGTHRDIALDLPGIERLIARAEPTAEDRREIAAWSRQLLRLAHMIGDAVPLIGRWLVQPATRQQMHDANSYLRDRGGIGTSIRRLVREPLDAAWAAGERILLIGHSLGSVICFDTLWELSQSEPSRRVDLFVTMGSPLATHFVRRRLRGTGKKGREAYPRNIRRWVNLSARGDTTALYPRLEPHFSEMRELAMVDTIEDHVDLENWFHGALGLNAHEAYGYMALPIVAENVGDFLERQ